VFRDLTLVECGGETLVIACDSLGGIGQKPLDSVRASAEVLGAYTVRVPLMEIMAAGADPLVVINTLSVEMDPTGRGILTGIKNELRRGGFAEDFTVTGSTEENMVTYQSAFGVTVIGKAKNENLRLGKSHAGDLLVCLGLPQVGEEVLKGWAQADIPLVRELLEKSYVHEILPVGSKGIYYEAKELAHGAGRKLRMFVPLKVDLKKSAGPGTCVLVTLEDEHYAEFLESVKIPVTKIAYLG
jgi:hypothetical protein